MRFTGKRILITGGTAGIGLAGARRIIAEGGQVTVTGRSPRGLPFAVSDDAGTAATGTGLPGPWDGLWLNAATATAGPPEAVDADTFDRVMAVNVRGPMLQLARLSAALRPGASVVITASSSAYEGAAATALYAASKGALIAMARSWATALAPRGIRVNTLVPGPIGTGFRGFLPAADRERFEQSVLADVPLARMGRDDEAAAVALFLLSDDASYVTGSQYAVDGGLVRR
jgi:NAD(P)-dependent dehydrogenase (short-subunit alcohol dehydrogenase family)